MYFLYLSSIWIEFDECILREFEFRENRRIEAIVYWEDDFQSKLSTLSTSVGRNFVLF
jgi:hypothetical protein